MKKKKTELETKVEIARKAVNQLDENAAQMQSSLEAILESCKKIENIILGGIK